MFITARNKQRAINRRRPAVSLKSTRFQSSSISPKENIINPRGRNHSCASHPSPCPAPYRRPHINPSAPFFRGYTHLSISISPRSSLRDESQPPPHDRWRPRAGPRRLAEISRISYGPYFGSAPFFVPRWRASSWSGGEIALGPGGAASRRRRSNQTAEKY